MKMFNLAPASAPTGVSRAVSGVAASLCASLALAPAPGLASDVRDLARLPLETLLDLEVSSASRYTQKTSEAPAAVTVITAEDIRHYGWRTLADLLRSVRGLYPNYDRNYSYLGTRGFARAGDYNTRVLLLVDGYRLNDSVYDQAPLGSEFPLDLDLIERVEYVPGPGSAVYGNSAFFGVINVITKNTLASSLSLEAASGQTRSGRAGYGARLANDAQLLLHVALSDSAGEDVAFPEFAALGGASVAHDLDHDNYRRFFAKLAHGPLTWQLGYGRRDKGIPTASFEQLFDAAGSQTIDTHLYTQLSYQGSPAPDWTFNGSLNYGRYDYDGTYLYTPPTLNRDRGRGAWWGGNLQLLHSGLAHHKVLLGLDYRDDMHIAQSNYDDVPYTLYLDDRRDRRSLGLYLQDEWTLTEGWLLNAGLRLDRFTPGESRLNPRLGLIHMLSPSTSAKLLYGTAYRMANAYERYYNAFGNKANPSLGAESITTWEAVLESTPREGLRLLASAYHYEIRNLISQTRDPSDGLLYFANLERAHANGLELELERHWDDGARLRASYALQRAMDGSGAMLSNSPRHLLKFNYSHPVFAGPWQAGIEAQYTGARKTLAGNRLADYGLVNLSLRRPLGHNLEVSASIYNLFDHDYADPASAEHKDSLFRSLDTIPQDGRSLRLALSWLF